MIRPTIQMEVGSWAPARRVALCLRAAGGVLKSTRAVTIGAPRDAVWPWLAQIGQGRGGLYSYDDLENLLGLDIRSADEILTLHQHPAPGDLIRLGKPGSPCFRVSSVDPGRSLVLISADNVTEEAVLTPVVGGTGATWQWVLNPVRQGRATRLVARQLNASSPRAAPAVAGGRTHRLRHGAPDAARNQGSRRAPARDAVTLAPDKGLPHSREFSPGRSGRAFSSRLVTGAVIVDDGRVSQHRRPGRSGWPRPSRPGPPRG